MLTFDLWKYTALFLELLIEWKKFSLPLIVPDKAPGHASVSSQIKDLTFMSTNTNWTVHEHLDDMTVLFQV